VTVASAIGSAQPFFALGYALFFKKTRPELFREAVGSRDLYIKAFFFVLTTFGIVMVVSVGSIGV
jgi:hypothetical protein